MKIRQLLQSLRKHDTIYSESLNKELMFGDIITTEDNEATDWEIKK